ncbi:iron-sulfur cluster assembly accessory protein [Nodosilinea sp. LEGE 06152]|uniref:HesB/IscA family protein n=1 Tax=Nodosilinea sp. LEGE 06152 TaxID=2777966 RepID=UPI00187F6AD0|nr:iron-sulfur cluster assembly accessory protein [Nodosilinea sp. LEGE 06152]MBE9158275.1 iron-sulfur cluster assembly accessory protein [Nodosilinea sp. LEGE 06152]
MIHIRPAAAQEIKRLLARQVTSSNQQQPLACLTLEPGGCAEWTYRLTAGAMCPNADTATTLDCDGIGLAVPIADLDLLQDLTIDYAEDLMGGGFRFVNPLAQRTCGCGNAFSLNADAPVSQDCTGGLPTG